MSTETSSGPPTMRMLANAQEVVSLLARSGPRSPAELADHLRIPRSSAYRLVDGLAAIHLVLVDDAGLVRLDLTWLHLADAARNAMSEWASARKLLDDLAGRTGLTAFLSVPRGSEAVCIDWSPGRGIGVLVLRPGRSLPLHTGGAGRVVMAFGVGGVDAAMNVEPLQRFTAATMTTRAQLSADVVRTREQGFAVSDQDVTTGIAAIAAPIFDVRGGLAGCLSLAGITQEIVPAVNHLSALLRSACAALQGQSPLPPTEAPPI